MLTILRAYSKQVDDVLVFVHHLHQLHLRDEVCQIFVCGVIFGETYTSFRKRQQTFADLSRYFCDCIISFLPLSILTATVDAGSGESLLMP